MYIRATGNISPQHTYGHPLFLPELVEYVDNRLSCIEPDYKGIIDAKQIRRMSRIIRMGVASALECLQEAGIDMPDAIITGTSYGCLEDTGIFLSRMIEYNEELLTPTSFIQSTHNTIGAQIGLLLQCNNYNNVFVHSGFSFESALLDGIMLLREKEASNVLIGAIDEITNISHSILNRMGLYKQNRISNKEIFKNKSKGSIAGEGATFFLLSNESSNTDYAKLIGLRTFYKPQKVEDIKKEILIFLEENTITLKEIDLIIIGKNGDEKLDRVYDCLQSEIFSQNVIINYKNLCGEYPTATAFALWLAVNIIKFGKIPKAIDYNGVSTSKIKNILIYNNYLNKHHSLLLLSECKN
ncbi:MAG: beta-ketoacyl synthase chain length factor [Bacteroidetes bacterium]|nr:beta-ketoacyl synthase chain length factor [Bacteroidota bacterium]